MRILLGLSALLLCVLTTNCDKTDPAPSLQFEATGQLLGSDKALCPCCGGWVITIDGDANTYRVESLPADSGIELTEDTLDVQFNWSLNRECGSIIYIDIEEIELN